MSIECATKQDVSRICRWLDSHKDVRYSVKGGQGGTMVFVLDRPYL